MKMPMKCKKSRTTKSRKSSPASNDSNSSYDDYVQEVSKQEIIDKIKKLGYVAFTGDIGIKGYRPDGSMIKDLHYAFPKGFNNYTIDKYPVKPNCHNSIFLKIHKEYGDLMVIDLDTKNKELSRQCLKIILDKYNLTNVWVDYTCNGGCHIYLKRPKSLENMSNKTKLNYNGVEIDFGEDEDDD